MDKKFELFVKCEGCNTELFRDTEYIQQGDGVCIIVKPCPVCAAEQQRVPDGAYPCDCFVDYGVDENGKCKRCGGTPRR